MNKVHFELDVPQGFGANPVSGDVRTFLMGQGVNAMMEAYTKGEELQKGVISSLKNIPRDGSVSVGAASDTHGNTSVSASATWNF